jgi:hypothetical protein
MKKVLLLLILVSTFPFISFSQKNLVPGTVVTTKGDTLSGIVDFRDWENNPTRIRFGTSPAEMKMYLPSELKSFWTDTTEIYISKRLSMDVSPSRLDELVNNSDQIIVPDTTVFVKLLAGGNASLYFLHDKNGKDHYWIQKVSDSVYEMTVDRKLVVDERNSGRSVATLDKYKLFLPGIMSDCPSMEKEIASATFNRASFTRLINHYNECISPGTIQYFGKQSKTMVKLGFVAGVSILKLNFIADEKTPIGKTDFERSWTYNVGVSMKVILPFLNGSWVVYNDLTYQPYHACDSVRIDLIYVPGTYWMYNYNLKMGYLKLNTMLRYQYPRWKVKPFFSAGFSNSYAVLSNPNLTVDKHIVSIDTIITTHKTALDEIKRYEIGVIAAIGVCYQGFGAEIRYESANGMSPYSTITAIQNSFTLMLNYTLGEK